MRKFSVSNFRDMGGLDTKDGRTFKFGKLYRTSPLIPKNSFDKQYIEDLLLDYIVDLRMPNEIMDKKDYIPSGCEYVNLNVLNKPDFQWLALTKEETRKNLSLDEKGAEKFIKDAVATYDYMPYSKEAWDAFFTLLDNGKTIAYHCTAGKDRTGLAALFIEQAMGREMSKSIDEYMLSNVYREAFNKKMFFIAKLAGITKGGMIALKYGLTNHIENIEMMLNMLNKEYGSFDNFMKEYYDVTDERKELWKSFYLD